MFYYQNLEDLVFTRYQYHDCDELIILSGYVGPHPVGRLNELPIKSTVIYGMYGAERIRKTLHNSLIRQVNDGNVELLYSTIPVHSKCYVWRSKGVVVHALVGSANFSTSGLTTPFKEVLAETTVDTWKDLNSYLALVIGKAIPWEDAVLKSDKTSKKMDEEINIDYDPFVCSIPLFVSLKGIPIVPTGSGLNWGLTKNKGSHVNINDAYLPIRVEHIRNYPLMFPVKQEYPVDEAGILRVNHRHNDNVEILWDDGTNMKGLLEGSQPVNVNEKTDLYPKQFCTTPHKAELGKYLRKRLGVEEGVHVTYEDLVRYGRTSIDISLQGEGIYFFDFSV